MDGRAPGSVTEPLPGTRLRMFAALGYDLVVGELHRASCGRRLDASLSTAALIGAWADDAGDDGSGGSGRSRSGRGDDLSR
jgi:hypothetical protein